ncbi:MAG: transglycosylase SLT domain-containing protein [Candidatus Micrarchaeaceae archaeon]
MQAQRQINDNEIRANAKRWKKFRREGTNRITGTVATSLLMTSLICEAVIPVAISLEQIKNHHRAPKNTIVENVEFDQSYTNYMRPTIQYNYSKVFKYKGLIQEMAEEYDLNPVIVASIVKIESNGNPYGVSSKGAVGLMGIKPSTAGLSEEDLMDPRKNMKAGTKYFKQLLEKYNYMDPDDAMRYALASYAAGPNAIDTKEGLVIPKPVQEKYLDLLAVFSSEIAEIWNTN